MVPAALSDSYEDITILPVIDYYQENEAEHMAQLVPLSRMIVQSYTNPDEFTDHPWRRLLMLNVLNC